MNYCIFQQLRFAQMGYSCNNYSSVRSSANVLDKKSYQMQREPELGNIPIDWGMRSLFVTGVRDWFKSEVVVSAVTPAPFSSVDGLRRSLALSTNCPYRSDALPCEFKNKKTAYLHLFRSTRIGKKNWLCDLIR